MAARKLLKHPFFDGIRALMDPRRLRPGDPLSASMGSSHSSEVDCLSCRGSVQKVERTKSGENSYKHSARESEGYLQHSSSLQSSMRERQEPSQERSLQGSRSEPNPSPFMMKTDKEGQNFSIQCSKADGNNLFFSLRFQDRDGESFTPLSDQNVMSLLTNTSLMVLLILCWFISLPS